MIFRPTPDATVRLVNLQAGQLEMLEELAPTDAEKVRNDPKLRLTTETGLGFAAIAFNLHNGPKSKGPFGSNAKLREALEAAIDRNAINQVVMSGLFVPDNQTELPNSPLFDKDVPVPPRDLAKAKALVKASGVDHPVLEFRVQNTARDTQVGEVVQSMAAEAGIEVKLMAGEANANIQAMAPATIRRTSITGAAAPILMRTSRSISTAKASRTGGSTAIRSSRKLR